MVTRLQALWHRSMTRLIVDFDLTLTNTETTPILGQFGLDTGKHCKQPWSYFVSTYMDDYGKMEQREAEARSLARIHQNGVFKGLTRAQIYEYGQSRSASLLRAGVKEALGERPFDVVSVNWSPDWIRGVLDTLPVRQVYCNDLIYDGDYATGEIEPAVLVTEDKQAVIRKHVPEGDYLYVGDSMGDLLPLVDARIPIVIGDNKKLLDTLRDSYSICLQEPSTPSSRPQGRVGYRVDQWDQISSILSSSVSS
ncbi:HAD-like domain-containing protein, partial [Syncephalastrum racemosum]